MGGRRIEAAGRNSRKRQGVLRPQAEIAASLMIFFIIPIVLGLFMKKTIWRAFLIAGLCTGLGETALAEPIESLSAKSANAVTAYTIGSEEMTVQDLLPMNSSSSGYSQKWEFYLYTRPCAARVKFEISNFAFSKNEGKVKGYVKCYDGDQVTQEYRISESFKSGSWQAASDRLDLKFGSYTLTFDGSTFHLDGSFEKGTFSYDVPARFWKPGTGDVYFGNSKDNVFRYGVTTYQSEVSRGVVTLDGKPLQVTGTVYGNHYLATIPVYDMFDELADSRKITDDVHLEFRYFVPSEKYASEPFGFMFVASAGVPLISSIDLERTPVEKWVDDDNYGYEIDMRQQIVAKDDGNLATIEMQSALPEPSDPYADLPAFQKNIASRFAKPIEYSIQTKTLLWLNVDGFRAKIPRCLTR